MPTQPEELNSSPDGAPRVNAVPGDLQGADAVTRTTRDVVLRPGRPLKSVTIEEECNVVQIFSPWGKPMGNPSALEIQNYQAALRNIDNAEKNLQDDESAFDAAYDRHHAELQKSDMRVADEKVKNNYLCVMLTPYVMNIKDKKSALESAHEKADEAWLALQLSVNETPVYPALTTNGTGSDDLPEWNAEGAHGLISSSHAGVVQTSDFCCVGSAMESSGDDEMTILPPPLLSSVAYSSGHEVETSEAAHSEEFDLAG